MQKIFPNRSIAAVCVLAITLLIAPNARAATRTKANNTDNLNLTTSWTGGVVPGSGDIALWDSTVTGGNHNYFLGADLNFGEIQITNPSGAVGLNSGTLTLSGVSGVGIDMSSATHPLNINCDVILGAAQSWNTGGTSGINTGFGSIDLGGFVLTLGGTNPGTGIINKIISSTTAGNGLTKTDTGVWQLGNANTYTGLTTVSAGTLRILNGSALGSTTGSTTVSSGATLQLLNNITVGVEQLFLNGTGASGQNGALVNNTGTNNYGGIVTLQGNATISSDLDTLNLTNTGSITGAGFNLTLNGSGNGSVALAIDTVAGGLIKNGIGTWTLTNASNYSGTTTINRGILSLDDVNNPSLARLRNTSSVAVNSSGTLLLTQSGPTASTDRINDSGNVL